LTDEFLVLLLVNISGASAFSTSLDSFAIEFNLTVAFNYPEQCTPLVHDFKEVSQRSEKARRHAIKRLLASIHCWRSGCGQSVNEMINDDFQLRFCEGGVLIRFLEQQAYRATNNIGNEQVRVRLQRHRPPTANLSNH